MDISRMMNVIRLGLLLGLCGCYHYAYSPYGNNGMGAYPYGPSTYPSSPGNGYIQPSPTYVPGGSPTNPSYGSPPSNGGPTPLYNPPNGTSPPGGGNSAPTWGPPSGNPQEPNYNGNDSEKKVPDPTKEDDEKTFGAEPGASLPPGYNGSSISGIQLEPIEPDPGTPTGAADPSSTLADNQDFFEPPVRSVSRQSKVASSATTDSRPNPYDYDGQSYTWLRGIVDYDSDDQRWLIIYSVDPNHHDRYGGSMTLSDHPNLQKIKPGDVILVEGELDSASLDRHGKPIYHVDQLKLLRAPRRN